MDYFFNGVERHDAALCRVSRFLLGTAGMALAALLFIAFAFCPLAIPTAAGQEDRATDGQESTGWYGLMEAGDRQFRFYIQSPVKDSAKDVADGAAVLVSLDEGEARFPLQEFAVTDSQLTFKIRATGADYTGDLSEDGSTARGTWQQRGARIPLDFRRVASLPTDQPEEVWTGTLKTGLQDLEMRLRGYRQPDGSLRYLVDSTTQRAGGFLARVTTQDDQHLELEIPALRATYRGEYTEDRQKLGGKWRQVFALDLEFQRVAADRLEQLEPRRPRRPQQPQPPFPYRVREVQFPGDQGKHQLAGTLTLPEGAALPEGDKRFPLAILISGSGPQDRDSTILDHRPFLVLADYLTRQGIAVLRYDERGVGESGGDFATATSLDFAGDVQAAVAFARTLPEIDPSQIGLIGHSEGGLIAPLVASRDPQIAWLVLLAAPAVNGRQILLAQGQAILAAEGTAAQEQLLQRQLQEMLFDQIDRIDPAAELDPQLDAVATELLERLSQDLGQPEWSPQERENLLAGIRSGLQSLHSPWFRHFLDYEPGPTLEQVHCPVLALGGSLDLQVDSQVNLPLIEQHLRAGGNSQVTVRQLSGLNHLFQSCDSGAVTRYEKIEETLAPQFLEIVSTWIRDVTAGQ